MSDTKTLQVNDTTNSTTTNATPPPRVRPVMAEYIWIGGNGPVDLRSKTRVIIIEVDENDKPKQAVDLPAWNYDGSSTNQASVEKSEILLNPCSVFTDPFRGSPHVLVLCDTFDAETQLPLASNNRVNAFKVFKDHADKKGAFAFEQEYVVCESAEKGGERLATSCGDGSHYCGSLVHPKSRMVMENHLKACLVAGISMSGCNVEVMDSQLEYQVGPVDGLSACDQLWVSRYILMRLCEANDLSVSFDPKIVPDKNGSGCHMNFSTEEMREGSSTESGLDHILAVMPKLEAKHSEYVKLCGDSTVSRLTGTHETSSYKTFTHGIGDRSVSVRIPKLTELNKKGYLEDRRPSSNVDPYVVAPLLLAHCVSA